jgi:(1->4)-alpha-D-glucan 1-alpha-D-glucosylmutase
MTGGRFAGPRPVAAYRYQQWTEGGFAGAAARIPHLVRLGASHLYTAPVVTAAPGSTHGYDGVDPTTIAPQLGGPGELDDLVVALESAGLGWVLDIVPNHLGVGVPEINPWWWSVLRHGPSSPAAPFFDIDWEATGGRVVLPVLGSPLADLVAGGAISVEERGGEAVLSVSGLVVPLRPDVPVPAPDRAGGADPSAADLAELLDQQHYRLDWWRAGTRNYRVFFDVNDLVGVRVEDQEVFTEVHGLVARLVAAGQLHGVRVDHIDGLVDPDGYLRRLRDLVGPERWLLVEKIVIGDETTPDRWPTDGTTGYEAAAWITRLLVDPGRETEHTTRFERRTGRLVSWPTMEQHGKDAALASRLAVDVARLADRAATVDHHPIPPAAVAAVAASLPVYRTYLPAGGDSDSQLVTAAVADAARRHPDLTDEIEEFGKVLLPPTEPVDSPDQVDSPGQVLLRWQQLTGPAMAKGVEDTALYRHRRLGALNDVGTDPDRFGCSIGEFHRAMERRQETCALGLTTTSTHDTKRSSDVRARLAVLPGVGPAWDVLADRWWPSLTTGPDDLPPLTAHLLLETVVGAWPISDHRLSRFLTKAEREAGLETSWWEPNEQFEATVSAAVERLLADPAFITDVEEFVNGHLLAPGRVNALTQVVLRCMVPGVPDIYQGDEIWNLRLVDPDNRAPVDWVAVEQAVTRISDPRPGGQHGGPPDTAAADAMNRSDDGDPKALVLVRCLAVRRRHPETFGSTGAYRPLPTSGDDQDRILAFERSGNEGGGAVAVIVPRFPERGPIEARVELPPGRWRDGFARTRVLTGGAVASSELFETFPVAVLERDEPDHRLRD